MLMRRFSAARNQSAPAGFRIVRTNCCGTVPAMSSYRVYFLDDRDRIVSATDIRAADDEDALAQGVELCDAASGCVGIEVWHRTRLVHRHNKAAA
jgi:hypothetical protein